MLYFISLIYCLLIYIYISDSPSPTTLHLVPFTFHLFLNDRQQYCNRSMVKCLKVLMYTRIVAQMDVSGIKYIIFFLTYWNCNVLIQGGTKVVTFGICVCGGRGGGGDIVPTELAQPSVAVTGAWPLPCSANCLLMQLFCVFLCCLLNCFTPKIALLLDPFCLGYYPVWDHPELSWSCAVWQWNPVTNVRFTTVHNWVLWNCLCQNAHFFDCWYSSVLRSVS